MRKILFVSVHPPGRVPSQRFRFEQYVGFLRDHGYETTFSPVLHPSEYDVVYESGHHARKAAIAGRGVARRLADLARASRYDAVIVQREATQLGTVLFERGFNRSGVRLLFDFDDAIWLRDYSEANAGLAWLKRPDKTRKIIAASDLVLAGNDYLADYARRFNPRVEVVPTTIDTERYVRLSRSRKPGVCIGWSGSMTTIRHFVPIVPVLRRVRARYGDSVRFKVIGDEGYRDEELGIEGRAWDPATEVVDLSDIDIGLMPLPDDDWARGKCGLKGLQYMALEAPAVMSPVGVNTKIVEDGRNGFLADSADEWFEKLSALVESADLRHKLGRAARETVVHQYSLESQRWRYLECLNGENGA
jgi:glycosyltransferase involved in cell wall biosynthesis